MYAVYQTESINEIVAIIMDDDVNITTKNFKYRIRTPGGIPNVLYKIDTEDIKSLDDIFLHNPPLALIQMCLDEAIIKMKTPTQSFKTKVCLCRIKISMISIALYENPHANLKSH